MYLLLILRNTFRNELGVLGLHGGFCVDVGIYLDAVSRAALRANGDRVFPGTPAESYVAVALRVTCCFILVCMSCQMLRKTYNFCSYHIKIESCWHFLKMAATMLFVPISHRQYNDMILIKVAGKV